MDSTLGHLEVHLCVHVQILCMHNDVLLVITNPLILLYNSENAKPMFLLDNSGSDSRNLIGQLQVSKCGRNLERDSKCQWGGF